LSLDKLFLFFDEYFCSVEYIQREGRTRSPTLINFLPYFKELMKRSIRTKASLMFSTEEA